MAILLLCAIPTKQFAQQPRQIKVSEFSVSHIPTIEERVFVVHAILDHGYFCYKNPDKANTIDVYVGNDAPDELSDFDFFFDNLLFEQRNEFSYLDKNQRGELFVQWRYGIDDEVFKTLYEDFTRGVASDNATCETASPFCTDVGLYSFPAGTNSGSPCGDTYNAHCSDPYACSGTPGQSSNCLSTAPNPAFYFLRIDEPGNLNIYMYSTPLVDIDFDCWGPFADMSTACDMLACSNIVDCSYSTSATENCHINNAQSGEYYILLITNFSNSPCNISFENTGTGTTDCSILPPLVNGGGPYCVGETINLTAQNQIGATFSWSGPNGFNSTEQNPVIPNCTMEMAGVYTCTITVGSETSSAETDFVEVVAQPTADFSFVAVCEGSPMQFTNTSTTNPSGQAIEHIEWDFGDGNTSDETNPSHTYAQAGEYEVTLSVGTTYNMCTDQKTQTVSVYTIPAITTSAEPASVFFGGIATIGAEATNASNCTYHWEPANMVVDPNSPTTQTVNLEETQVYTVTVTNLEGGCTNTAQVTVVMAGSNLTATASADQYILCDGETTTLHALPLGGTGSYTYSWSPANLLNNANIQDPVATPPVGTTVFTCTVNDGYTTQIVDVSIRVYGHVDTEPLVVSTCDSYDWQGVTYTTPGVYTENLYTSMGCDSIVHLDLSLQYTPTPTPIFPKDPDNTAPHWVITATEFQINSYEFYLWDNNTACHWDSVTWAFANPDIQWILEPDESSIPKGLSCTMYVLDHVDDTVWLSAKAYNGCAPQGIERRYWFVCSFYDVDEHNMADFGVAPNPNNGQMTLNFENFFGPVEVKVYDMRGTLLDRFVTRNETDNHSLTYHMSTDASGIYFFVVTGRNGTVARKVVVAP